MPSALNFLRSRTEPTTSLPEFATVSTSRVSRDSDPFRSSFEYVDAVAADAVAEAAAAGYAELAEQLNARNDAEGFTTLANGACESRSTSVRKVPAATRWAAVAVSSLSKSWSRLATANKNNSATHTTIPIANNRTTGNFAKNQASLPWSPSRSAFDVTSGYWTGKQSKRSTRSTSPSGLSSKDIGRPTLIRASSFNDDEHDSNAHLSAEPSPVFLHSPCTASSTSSVDAVNDEHKDELAAPIGLDIDFDLSASTYSAMDDLIAELELEQSVHNTTTTTTTTTNNKQSNDEQDTSFPSSFAPASCSPLFSALDTALSPVVAAATAATATAITAPLRITRRVTLPAIKPLTLNYKSKRPASLNISTNINTTATRYREHAIAQATDCLNGNRSPRSITAPITNTNTNTSAAPSPFLAVTDDRGSVTVTANPAFARWQSVTEEDVSSETESEADYARMAWERATEALGTPNFLSEPAEEAGEEDEIIITPFVRIHPEEAGVEEAEISLEEAENDATWAETEAILGLSVWIG